MSAEKFKLDVLRLERIRLQAERGEELSAEDVAYVRECVLQLAALLKPFVEAYVRAVKSLAKSLAESIATAKKQAATNGSVIEKIEAAERRAAIYASPARPGVNNMADVVRRTGRERHR